MKQVVYIFFSFLAAGHGDLVCFISGNSGCTMHCVAQGKAAGECKSTDQEVDCVCEENTDFQHYAISSLDPVLEDFEPLTYDDELQEIANDDLTWLVRNVVFLPIVRSGLFGMFRNLSDPSTYGLEHAVNTRIPSVDNSSLGAWYIWPQHLGTENKSGLRGLKKNDTLFIYFHGNSATRGFNHRVELYRLLTGLGFHVLTFDYRGFGDSGPANLSETSVVSDALAVLDYVAGELAVIEDDIQPRVIVWGHSLGTAVATHALATLKNSTQELEIGGIILESPFTKMIDVAQNLSMATFTAEMLNVDLEDALKAADVEFLSSEYIIELDFPIMILHAEDDYVIPYEHAERLFQSASSSTRGSNITRLFLFERKLRLRHRYIYQAPALDDIILNFLMEANGQQN